MSKKLHREGSSDALNASIEISRFEENDHYQRKTGSTSSKQPPICFHMLCEDIVNHKEARLDDEKSKEESAKKHLSFALNLPYVWKPQGSTVRPISRGLVDLRSRTPTGELEKNEHLKKELRLTPECFSFLREHYGRLGKMGRTGLGTLERFYYDEREAMFRFLNMVLCGAVKGVSINREQVQAIVHSATESLELYTKPDTEQDVQYFESENETKRRDRLHVANCLATLLFLAVYITDADLDESKVLGILSETAFGTKLLFKKGARSSGSSIKMPSFAASLVFTVLSYAKSKTFSGANDGIFLKVYGLTNFIEANRIKAVFQPSQSKELGFLAIEEALRTLEHETETASTYHFFQYAAFCFVVNEPKLIGTDFFLDPVIWKHVVDILCLSLRNNATICEMFCDKASTLNIKCMSPDIEVVFGLLSDVAREVCITAQCFEDIVPQPSVRSRILDILVPPRDAPGNPLPVAAIQFVETLFASNLDSVDSIKSTFFADDWKAVLGFVKRSFYYAVANTSNFGASAAVFGLMRHLLYISDAPIVDFVFENTVFRTNGTSARYAPSDLRSPEACCALKRLVDLHTALLSSAAAEIYSDKDPSAVYAAMFANVSELCRCITDTERCPCEPLLAFDLIRSAIKFLNAVALSNTHRGKSVLIKEFTSFVLRGQSLAKIFSFIIYSKYQNNMNQKYIDRESENVESKRIKAIKAAFKLLKNSLTLVAINNSIASETSDTNEEESSNGRARKTDDALSKQCFLVNFAVSDKFMAYATTECLRTDSLVPSILEFLSALYADFSDMFHLDSAASTQISYIVLDCLKRKFCVREVLEFLRQSLCARVPLFAVFKDKESISNCEEIQKLLADEFKSIIKVKPAEREQKRIPLELLDIFASLQFTFDNPNVCTDIFDKEFFETVFFLLRDESSEDGHTALCKAKCLEILLNHAAASSSGDSKAKIAFPEGFWNESLERACGYARESVNFPTNNVSAKLFSVLRSAAANNYLAVATALNSAGRRAVGAEMVFFDTEHYAKASIGYVSDVHTALKAYNDFVLLKDATYLYTKNMVDLVLTCHMKGASSALFKETVPMLLELANGVFESVGIFGFLSASNIVSNASLIEVATLLNFFAVKVLGRKKKPRAQKQTLSELVVSLAAKIVSLLCEVERPHVMLSERSTGSLTVFEQSSAIFRCLSASASSAAAFETLLNLLNNLVLIIASPDYTPSEVAVGCVPMLLPLVRKLTDTVLRNLSPSNPSVRCTLILVARFVRLSNIDVPGRGSETKFLDFDLGRVFMDGRKDLFVEPGATRDVAYSVVDAMIDSEYFRMQVSTSFLARALFDDDMLDGGYLNERALILLTKLLAACGSISCIESVTNVLQERIDVIMPFLNYSFLQNDLNVYEAKLEEDELYCLRISCMLNKLLFIISYHLGQWKPKSVSFYMTLLNVSMNSLSIFYQNVLLNKDDAKLSKEPNETFIKLMHNEVYVLDTILELLKRFCSASKSLCISNAKDFVANCSSSVNCLVSLLKMIKESNALKAICTEAVIKLVAVINICSGAEEPRERGRVFTEGVSKFLLNGLFRKGSLEEELVKATY